MIKEQFYRKDFKTFKPKYYLFCRKCEIKLYCKNCDSKITPQKFGELTLKPYICQIKIEEIK